MAKKKKEPAGHAEGKWWFDTDGDGHQYRLPMEKKDAFVALKSSGNDDDGEWREFDPWIYYGKKENLPDE